MSQRWQPRSRFARWYRQLGEKCSGLWTSAENSGSNSIGAPFRARRLRIEPLEQREVLSATLAFDTTAYETDASSKKLQVNYTVSGGPTSSAFDIELVGMDGATPVTLMTGTVASGQADGTYHFDFSDDMASLLADSSFKLVLDPAHSVMGSSPETAYVGSFIDDSGVIVIQGTSGADTVDTTVASGELTFTLDSKSYAYTLAGTTDQPVVTSLQARMREGNDTVDQASSSVPLVAYGGDGDDLLVGGTGNDTLNGNGGANEITGNAGHDTINGGTGDEILSGGTGNDTLNSGGGYDAIDGNEGVDILNGGDGYNILTGGLNDTSTDELHAGTGINEIDSYDGGEGGSNARDKVYVPHSAGPTYLHTDSSDDLYWNDAVTPWTVGAHLILLVNLNSTSHDVSVNGTQIVVDGESGVTYTGANLLGIGGSSSADHVTVNLPNSGAIPTLTLRLGDGTDSLDVVGSDNADTITAQSKSIHANGTTIDLANASTEDVDIDDGGLGDDTIGAILPVFGSLPVSNFTSDDYGNNTLIFTDTTNDVTITGGYSTTYGTTSFSSNAPNGKTITGTGFRRYDLNAENVTLNDVRIDHYYDVDAATITLDGDIITNGTITPGDSFTLINNVVGNALAGSFTNQSSVAVGDLAYRKVVPPPASNDFDMELLTEDFGDEIEVGPMSAATGHDTLPRFAASPTIWAIDNGDWFDPDTWSADRVPTNNDVVYIPAGITVNYDDESSAEIKAIDVWGSLVFADDEDTALLVGTLTVLPLGTLTIGTVANPIGSSYTATLTIADQALESGGANPHDPKQYGTGLLVFGKTDIHGTPHTETWLRLAEDALADDGDSNPDTLTFESGSIPSTWAVGQKLVLPDTRQPYKSWDGGGSGKSFGSGTLNSVLQLYQTEVVTIASISGDVVTLVEDLQWSHEGQSYVDHNTQNSIDLYPHAALLTRNVLIHSENPAGTRGHTFYTGRAEVDVEYAQFKDLGRTSALADISNSSQNLQGVWTIGTNQVGRYAVHFHHLLGPVNSNPSTPDMAQEQLQFIGNTVQDSMKWAVAVHGTSFGVLEDNVVYAAQGAGFVTEDGSEIGNRFIHNISISTRGTSQGDGGGLDTGTDYGRGGHGFWFRRMGNIVQDNVSADHSYAGYMINGYYPKALNLPNFPGANPESETDGTALGANDVNKVNYLPSLYDYDEVFANNEGYGMSAFGLWAAYTLGNNLTDHTGSDYETLFTNFTFWNEGFDGLWIYHTNHVTFDGLVMIADPDAANAANNGNIGMKLDYYENLDTKATNVHIENYVRGIVLPTVTTGDLASGPQGTFIENAYLRNHLNVWASQPDEVEGSSGVYVKLTDVTFEFASFGTTSTQFDEYNFDMDYGANPDPTGKNLTSFFVLQVENFNYDTYTDEDFQVYFEAQDPDATYHQSREDWAWRLGNEALIRANRYFGAPILADGDHDNQYYFDNYGAAFAGSIAPDDALDSTWNESALKVNGLVGSYKNPFTNSAAVAGDEDFPGVDVHVQLTSPWDGAAYQEQGDYYAPYLYPRIRIYGSIQDLIDEQNGPTEVRLKFQLIEYSDEQESSIESDTTYTAYEDEFYQGVVWDLTPGHYKLRVYLADENDDELTGNVTGSEATFDILPLITISSVTQAETDSTTYFIFNVTLSSPKSTTLYVEYATEDGSATAVANADYTAATGTLTFAPSSTLASITVAVTGDQDDEEDEDFSVVLSNPTGPSGYTFNVKLQTGTYTGLGTIQDDD